MVVAILVIIPAIQTARQALQPQTPEAAVGRPVTGVTPRLVIILINHAAHQAVPIHQATVPAALIILVTGVAELAKDVNLVVLHTAMRPVVLAVLTPVLTAAAAPEDVVLLALIQLLRLPVQNQAGETTVEVQVQDQVPVLLHRPLLHVPTLVPARDIIHLNRPV